MNTVIIGGGKVGYYLFKTLRHKNSDITLIEKNIKICKMVSEDLEGEIICGDGSDIEVLKEADINKNTIIVAVTGKDEENLVICQMAKIFFNVQKTIARINNPKNKEVFKLLGISNTICSTELISEVIEEEFLVR